MSFIEYLEENSISILSISKATGIAYATLHNGIKNPTSTKTDNLNKLSKYLSLSMDDLYVMLKSTSTGKENLLFILREQKNHKLKGSIYHNTQIKFSYNTNRIEGSRLTEDQTRMIFETNTIINDTPSSSALDIIEVSNHFYLFDIMLGTANDLLSERSIKRFHSILKNGTSDSRAGWFNVGEYKKYPNEVGGIMTIKPENVEREMKKLINVYNSLSDLSIDDIIEFHYKFEKIHPFQDGNGRIGRLIMFRECLRNNIVPFIIEDEYKAFYYRGLSKYEKDTVYLKDTCLLMQDKYKVMVDQFL